MAKKRKSVATSLDEVDRTMYDIFCSSANSLSQLYTQAMNHQKLSFQAGERNSLEKLYQWILRQQEAGARVGIVDILNYLQAELDYHADEPSLSPRAPAHTQSVPFPNAGSLVSSGSSGAPASAIGFRSEPGDQQPKNYVFSNALSSPVRRSLQNYHISQGGGYFPNNAQPNGNRNSDPGSNQQQNRDSNHTGAGDSFMDMHAE